MCFHCKVVMGDVICLWLIMQCMLCYALYTPHSSCYAPLVSISCINKLCSAEGVMIDEAVEKS